MMSRSRARLRRQARPEKAPHPRRLFICPPAGRPLGSRRPPSWVANGARKLLVVGEGRFELRLPFSDRDNRWLKQELLREVFLDSAGAEVSRRDAVEARRKLGGSVTNTKDEDGELPDSSKALAKALTSTPALRFLWDNDVSILREQGLTTIRLGVLGDKSLRLHKAPGGLYHHELRDALRERGDRIEDGVPTQELERRFQAFRGREAKLPPQLAAKRR